MPTAEQRRYAPFVVATFLAVLIAGLYFASRIMFARAPVSAFEKAQAAALEGDTKQAVKLLDEVLAREPNHGQALLYRGQLARDAGDHEQAQKLWSREIGRAHV